MSPRWRKGACCFHRRRNNSFVCYRKKPSIARIDCAKSSGGAAASIWSRDAFSPKIALLFLHGDTPTKVVIDYNRCESNARCMEVAPEIFEVRDDDRLYILDEHPPEASRERVLKAVRICPKQAISIVEDK
jgi:ferredoxin